MVLTSVNANDCVPPSHWAGLHASYAALSWKQPVLGHFGQKDLVAHYFHLASLLATEINCFQGYTKTWFHMFCSGCNFTLPNSKARTAHEIVIWWKGEKSILIAGVEGWEGRRSLKMSNCATALNLEQNSWENRKPQAVEQNLWVCQCSGLLLQERSLTKPPGLCRAWVSEGREICLAQQLLITCKIKREWGFEIKTDWILP